MSYYKKVTLKDIANDSGVSVSSVSMILNKREGVSFPMKRLKRFCPLRKNWDMRFLLPKKRMVHPLTILKDPQNILLIFCPNISNSYYSTIAQSIEQAAYQKGFKL